MNLVCEGVDHDDSQGRAGSRRALNARQSVRWAHAGRGVGAGGNPARYEPGSGGCDRGYKGFAINGVKIYHPGLRRGITRGLRAMIRRQSAIEPVIGHTKTDGQLDRN